MLTLWNPFQTTTRPYAGVSLLNDFDSLFRDVALPSSSWRSAGTGFPAADVFESENALEVKVDLPGHDPKAIDVRLEGDTLTIASARIEETPKEGRYLRKGRSDEDCKLSFVLPQTVNGASPEARFDAGVLTITLPKREESKPRSIEVKVQSP